MSITTKAIFVMDWIERHPRFVFPLHPDLGLLAQRHRGSVCHPHNKADHTRRVPITPRAQKIPFTASSTASMPIQNPLTWTKDPNKIISAIRPGHQVLDRSTSTTMKRD